MSSSASTRIPMKTTLTAALAMAWAWGVVGGSVGLNALIKSNQTKSRFRKQVPPPTVVHIDTNDVFQSGVVLTVVTALIAVLCSIFLLAVFAPPTRGFAVRTFKLQAAALAFCAAWLFAALVPFTLFFATRSAKITAFVGTLQLPQQVIEQAEKALGSTSVYNKFGYLRLVAILPWFTLLFTILAVVVLFLAASPSKPTTQPAPSEVRSDTAMAEKESA